MASSLMSMQSLFHYSTLLLLRSEHSKWGTSPHGVLSLMNLKKRYAIVNGSRLKEDKSRGYRRKDRKGFMPPGGRWMGVLVKTFWLQITGTQLIRLCKRRYHWLT